MPAKLPKGLKPLSPITPDNLLACYDFLKNCSQNRLQYKWVFGVFLTQIFLPFMQERRVLREQFFEKQMPNLQPDQEYSKQLSTCNSIVHELLFQKKLVDPTTKPLQMLHDPINTLELESFFEGFGTPTKKESLQLTADARRKSWAVTAGLTSIEINEKTGFLDLQTPKGCRCPYQLPIEVANRLNQLYQQSAGNVPTFYHIVYAVMEAFSLQGFNINGGEQVRHIHIDSEKGRTRDGSVSFVDAEINDKRTSECDIARNARHAVIVIFSQQFFSYVDVHDGMRDILSASPSVPLFEFNFRLKVDLSDKTYPWTLELHYGDNTPEQLFDTILKQLVEQNASQHGSPQKSFVSAHTPSPGQKAGSKQTLWIDPETGKLEAAPEVKARMLAMLEKMLHPPAHREEDLDVTGSSLSATASQFGGAHYTGDVDVSSIDGVAPLSP